MHMIHKTFPTYEHDYTVDFDTRYRPLPEVDACDTYFIAPQSARESYWDENVFDQDQLEYKDNQNQPND